jgi:hypothetical protein
VGGPEVAKVVSALSLASTLAVRAQEGTVKTKTRKTAPLGELIAAAFDEAGRHSTDPREVSRLATRAVIQLMRRARRLSVPLQPAIHIDATHSGDERAERGVAVP